MPKDELSETRSGPRSRSTPRHHPSGRETRPAPRAVLLVGAGPRLAELRESFRDLGLACAVYDDPRRALRRAADESPIVVLVPPRNGLPGEGLCRWLLGRTEDGSVPVLAVGSSPEHAERLHRAGTTGAFTWPAERTALARAVLRLAGVGPAIAQGEARDVVLAARVEERIRSERETFGPLVTVRATDGVVFLGGEVDAAWKISELERLVGSMPGVEGVVPSGLRVPISNVPDRAVASGVRGALSSAPGVDERTFGIRVSGGRVVLTGTASTRDELQRALERIERVPGVRSVENLAAISRPAKIRERRLAGTLARLVRRRVPGSRIDVSVFGRTAVLSGDARTPAELRAVESALAHHPAVGAVVNATG